MVVASEFVFPTSFAQKRFWFLHQLNPDSSLYNVPIALELRGPLDTTVLSKAFEAIIERHEPLRTIFRLEDGELVQIVAEDVSFAPLQTTELT